MANLDTLYEVVERAGRLRSVSVARFEGQERFVTEAKLTFERVSLVVAADPDQDTVAVRIGEFTSDRAATAHDVSSSALWSPAIGLRVSWAWELRNQQGYVDGVRFEFTDTVAGVNRQVEFIVAGSALNAFHCQPSIGPAA